MAGREGDVRGSAAQVGSLVVAVSLGLGLVAWLLRDDLFHRDDAWFPVLVVLVMLACAAVGVVRGGLAGRGRFAAVAWSLVAENGLRCVLVGALLLADVDEPEIHGLALVAGGLVAVWPSAWRFTRGVAGSGAFAFLGGAATGQTVAQVVLTGGPVLLALLGGSPVEVTALFAALALFRAPYQVALGVLPQLTAARDDVRRDGRRGAAAGAGDAGWPSSRSSRSRWPGCSARCSARGCCGWSSAAPWTSARRSPPWSPPGSTLAVANVVLMVAALAGARDRSGSRARGRWRVARRGRRRGRARRASRRCRGRRPVFLVTEAVAALALAVVRAGARSGWAGRRRA